MGWFAFVIELLKLAIEIFRSLKKKNLPAAVKAQIVKEYREATRALHEDKNPKPLQEFNTKYAGLCADGLCDFTE